MDKQLQQFRQQIIDSFSLADLQTLAFDLGLNWDELAGETLSQKSIALITQLQRHNRLPALIDYLTKARPHLTWPQAGALLLLLQGANDDQLLLPIDPSPYKGLYAFTVDDADRFFGRQRYTQMLLDIVQKKPFLALLGSSGSGKSSLVQAGLQAQIDGKDWLSATFRPTAQPFAALATALLPLLDPNHSEVDHLLEQRKLVRAWREGDLTLADICQRILEKRPQTHLLLFADQFEQLFTLAERPSVPQPFIDFLLAASETSDCHLVVALRADFLSQALAYRPMADALQNNDLKLGPMNEAELREVITEPAKPLAVTFEPGLSERILTDVVAQPGHLPLLQFALDLLWEKQHNRQLTHAAYEEMGGVSGALATYADKIYRGLTTDEQDRARYIFGQLIQPGQGTEDTRRLARRSELSQSDWQLVGQLASHRLIVTGRDENEQETVEVTHEALIQRWDQIKEWLHQDRTFRIWQEEIRVILRQWQMSQDNNDLLQGTLLTVAPNWLETHRNFLSPNERAFIEASQAQQKWAANKRRLRNMALVIAATTIIISLIIATAIFQNQADVNAQLAQANENVAATAVTALAEVQAQTVLAQSLTLASVAQSLDAGDQTALLYALEAITRSLSIPSVNAIQKHFLATLPVQTVLSHGAGVGLASWNNAGNYILTSSFDGTAKVWDAERGDLLLTLSHDAGVSLASWNSDESRILTRSDDGTAKVWDANRGDLLFTLSHNAAVRQASWNSDESRILTRSDDGIAKVWDGDRGTLLFNLSHESAVSLASWNGDGSRILILSDDGTAKVWDAGRGDFFFTLPHDATVRQASWNSDESRILTRSDDGIAKVWDGERGGLLFTLSHEVAVRQASWNNDESRILTSSDDNSVRVWDAERGGLLFTLSHDTDVNQASWNSDGSRILTRSGNSAWVWDAEHGTLLFSLSHDAYISQVSWNNDESRILTLSWDNSAKVWNAESGVLLFTLSHDGWVNQASWNSDESRILTRSDDNRVKVWDAEHGVLLFALSHNEFVNQASWNSDGSRILTGSVNQIIVWQTQLLPILHDGSVFQVSWNSDGSRILTSSRDGTARIWGGEHGQLLLTLSHDGSVFQASWNSDGSRILTSSNDGTTRVWDTEHGNLFFTLSHDDESVNQASWNNNESRILTRGGNNARVWDAEHGTLLFTLSHDESVNLASWNSDGSRILTRSRNRVRVWDAEHGTLLFTLSHDDFVGQVSWNFDESQILTIDGNRARVWDAERGTLLLTLSHDASISQASWNSDGNQILTIDGNRARVWDAEHGTLLLTLSHDASISQASWNSDESQILTSSDDNSARVWDAERGALLLTLSHDDAVNQVSWNSDESRILTISDDNSARVWDGERGTLLFTLSHYDRVRQASWNRDESRILTLSNENIVRVWDAEHGALQHIIPGDGTAITHALWQENGEHILITTTGGLVRLYYADLEVFYAEACRRIYRNLTWAEWQLYLPKEPYRQTCPHLPSHSSVPAEGLQ